MKKKKIAMLTWHYYPNFGSALQAYALQRKLKALGTIPVLIDYRNKKYGLISSTRERLVYVLGKAFPFRFDYPFIRFRKEKLTLSRLVQDEERLPRMIRNFNAVLCGSDQIWAPNVINPVYLLDFVPDTIPKISYAASIGLNDIPDEMTDIYQKRLFRFSKISVREKAGAQLLQKKCGVVAVVMPDPTLLIEASQWMEIESKSLEYDNYIFCYFLNSNHSYQKAVREYADRNGLRIVGCSSNPKDISWMEQPSPKAGPPEFLWLIRHAACVFTDSYHGTIFSLLFHKDFMTFERFLPNDALCQNSRIYQLDHDFGMGNRIIHVSDDTVLTIAGYDYESFENKLCLLRESAIEYLKDALECC